MMENAQRKFTHTRDFKSSVRRIEDRAVSLARELMNARDASDAAKLAALRTEADELIESARVLNRELDGVDGTDKIDMEIVTGLIGRR